MQFRWMVGMSIVMVGCLVWAAETAIDPPPLAEQSPRIARTGYSADDMVAVKADKHWQGMLATETFVASLPDDPAAPPEPPTPGIANLWRVHAQLAWDPDYLYVTIESIGPAPILAESKQNGPRHGGDVVEIYLDVAGEMKQIVEVQLDPNGRTYSYFHQWAKAPKYSADHVDMGFYRANHSIDKNWGMENLKVLSAVEPAENEQVRWVARMAIPMKKILERSGLPPMLRPGQTVNINLFRYAYQNVEGMMNFRQYNLVPTKHGCPHHSPMAAVRFITAE